MSIAEKLTTIAENEQRVYEAGKTAEWSEFWEDFQKSGEETNYNYAISGERWTDKTYNPKYPISAKQMTSCFMNSKITDTKVPISFSLGSNNIFSGCKSLITIRSLTPKVEDFNWVNAFNNCTALENVTFDGIIDGTNISFGSCTKLTHESLINILEHLKNVKGTGVERSLTLGATNLAKLSENEIAIATQKGWTLA